MSLFKNECVETHVGDISVYKDRTQVGDIVFITVNNFKKYVPIDWIERKAFENPSLSRNLFYRMIIEEWEKENEAN